LVANAAGASLVLAIVAEIATSGACPPADGLADVAHERLAGTTTAAMTVPLPVSDGTAV